jgi:hypothetical protein
VCVHRRRELMKKIFGLVLTAALLLVVAPALTILVWAKNLSASRENRRNFGR